MFYLKIYIHSDLPSLHEHIPQAILPDWAGGELTQDEAFDSEHSYSILNPENEEYYKKYSFTSV
jgi:hypothetical protein